MTIENTYQSNYSDQSQEEGTANEPFRIASNLAYSKQWKNHVHKE